MRVRILLVIVVACGWACRSNPTSPSNLYTGTWTGTAVDSVGGTGTASLVITQSGQGLTGTWTSTFPVASRNGAGSLSGSVSTSSSTATIAMTPASGFVCSPTQSLTGTLGLTANISSNRLTGNYTVLTCTSAISGTVDLTKP